MRPIHRPLVDNRSLALYNDTRVQYVCYFLRFSRVAVREIRLFACGCGGIFRVCNVGNGSDRSACSDVPAHLVFCAVRILFASAFYVVGERKHLVFASPEGLVFPRGKDSKSTLKGEPFDGSPLRILLPTTQGGSIPLENPPLMVRRATFQQPNRPFLIVRAVSLYRRAATSARTRVDVLKSAR